MEAIPDPSEERWSLEELEMKSPSKRNLRRHHARRLKRKRRRYWGRSLVSQRDAGIVAKTPKPCSCWMCGNPRRYSGEPTLQERKSAAALRLALSERPGSVPRTPLEETPQRGGHTRVSC
jgi:hypothetical protein